MSFRSIRPSDDPVQASSASASASHSGPAGEGSNRSGSGGPEGSQGGGQGGRHGGSSGGLSERRRRAPTYVTQNACLNCKKARAKCNGQKPVCHRCASRGLDDSCKYEVHVKTAKEMMVREIRDLQEKNDWVEHILRAISADDYGPEIIDRLKNGESYQSVAASLGRPPFADVDELSPTSQRQLTDALMDYEMDQDDKRDSESGIRHDGEWTSVTNDHDFIDHLFALYFTWVHPVHMLFSRNHFISSYRNQSNLYCTSSLVNAVCAMGCLFMGENGKYSSEDGYDPDKFRGKFMDESRSLIKPEHYNKRTIVQTFAVMFLVELGQGQGARASSYIRLAGDAMNSMRDNSYSTEAMEITKWGIYALNCAWGQYTFQVPAVFQIPASYDLPHFKIDGHNCLWRFYRNAGDKDIPEKPSSSVMAASEFAQLMRLVHNTTLLYYGGHESKVKAHGILKQYQSYLEWKDDLPDDLADTDNDDKMVPHVLSLHIQYCAAMVLLFRPLLHLKALPEATMDHLRVLTIDYAWQGLEIQRRYHRLFTCRYQPSLQNFSLLHFGDALLRFALSEVDGKEIVQFCLQVLKESADGRGGFAVCGPLQEMFRRCAVECRASMPDNLPDLLGSEQYGPDKLLDACTRLSYTQPIDQVVSNIDDEVAHTFAEEWRKFIEGPGDDESMSSEATRLSERSAGEQIMKIGSLLNE